MPSTFMGLTNRLLRRINEAEISESDFPSVQNIQATAKDCVLDTIRKINNHKPEWPFNAVEHTQPLAVGVEEYAWPLAFTFADWESFQIEKDDTLNIETSRLKFIHRDEWYKYLRDRDYDSGTAGIRLPSFVFPSHGRGFGVSPSPDEIYTIKYRYYKNPDDLVSFDDETTIPTQFDYVIMAGALYHMFLFKENETSYDRMKQAFEEGIKDMTNTLLEGDRYAYSTVSNFGGGTARRSNMWTGQ